MFYVSIVTMVEIIRIKIRIQLLFSFSIVGDNIENNILKFNGILSFQLFLVQITDLRAIIFHRLLMF